MMFLSKILIYRKDLYQFNGKFSKNAPFFDLYQKTPSLIIKDKDPISLDNISSFIDVVDSEKELIQTYTHAIAQGFPCIYIMDNQIKIAVLIGPAEEEALRINKWINP